MKTISYGDFTFPYNPDTVKVIYSRQVVSRFSPFYGSVVEDYGLEAACITGEGEFSGALAETDAALLAAEFRKGGNRTFTVGEETFRAYFSTLTLVRNAGARGVRFLFEFVEASS